MKDQCKCGHSVNDHIYNEGACRPGFACECQKFDAKQSENDLLVVKFKVLRSDFPSLKSSLAKAVDELDGVGSVKEIEILRQLSVALSDDRQCSF